MRLTQSASIVELARGRTSQAHFAVPDVEIVRVAQLAGGSALIGSLSPSGSWKLEGNTLYAHIPDDMYAAESILRLAWQISTLRQGGVLFHSSGVSSSGHALIAIGRSGDGKSTLAGLCVNAGARLLSDEIVQVLPGGRVRATPFRSDLQVDSEPHDARAKYFVVLKKGDHEALDDAEPLHFVSTLLSQVYMHPAMELELSPAELRRRVLTLVSHGSQGTLTFRKHDDAGHFVRKLLDE